MAATPTRLDTPVVGLRRRREVIGLTDTRSIRTRWLGNATWFTGNGLRSLDKRRSVIRKTNEVRSAMSLALHYRSIGHNADLIERLSVRCTGETPESTEGTYRWGRTAVQKPLERQLTLRTIPGQGVRIGSARGSP